MSDDQVKRYQLDYHHTQTYAEMVEDCDGDWVKYNDYKAASDRIEELELAVRYEADLAQQAEARIEELEAELAKAIDFVAEVGGGLKFGESLVDWANLHVLKARTLLAELKGETDE